MAVSGGGCGLHSLDYSSLFNSPLTRQALDVAVEFTVSITNHYVIGLSTGRLWRWLYVECTVSVQCGKSPLCVVEWGVSGGGGHRLQYGCTAPQSPCRLVWRHWESQAVVGTAVWCTAVQTVQLYSVHLHVCGATRESWSECGKLESLKGNMHNKIKTW